MRPTRRALLGAATAVAASGAWMASERWVASETWVPSGAWAQARRTAIIPFGHSAFPYDGAVPDSGKPFLDVERDGKRGHTSPRGGVYFTDSTYSSRETLLHVGAGFRPSGDSALVLFFHGNKATLREEVVTRQRIVAQFDASGFNGALVAPQLAVNALDSSGGRFWERGFLSAYLNEAAQRLAALGAGSMHAAPVIVIAYSGGYNPAIYALLGGGGASRIKGVVLMDALFGELPNYAQWIAATHSRAFFVSAFGPASAKENAAMKSLLAGRGVAYTDGVPQKLTGGGVWFIDSRGASHNDFMTRAWAAQPLRDILMRMR